LPAPVASRALERQQQWRRGGCTVDKKLVNPLRIGHAQIRIESVIGFPRVIEFYSISEDYASYITILAWGSIVWDRQNLAIIANFEPIGPL
jgi:hypothetical protein